MQNKKKMLIAGASTLGVAALGLGVFAYFNDKAETTDSAKIGTVDVNVSGVGLNHQDGLNNLNPGDNDPTVPNTYRPGTDHELSFTVTNDGTKSVVTRTVIEVTSDNTNLTAEDLQNIILSLKDANDTSALGASAATDARDGINPLTPSGTGITGNANALVYIVGGTGDNAALSRWVLDGSEEKETIHAEDVMSMTYTYDVGLAKGVSAEKFEGSVINIKVTVQGMQYRNTGDAEWETLFGHTYTTQFSNSPD